MALNYKDHDCITYHISTMNDRVKQIILDYGDWLEGLSAVDKLHLLLFLTKWQTLDTERREDRCGTYSLETATKDHADLLPEKTLKVITTLEGLTDDDCFDLMVAIANQIRDRVFAG